MVNYIAKSNFGLHGKEIHEIGRLFSEIGDLKLQLQAKLLRILQERTVERIGSVKPFPLDVRIIVAMHQNLEERVAMGEFRQDLDYRLNVYPV